MIILNSIRYAWMRFIILLQMIVMWYVSQTRFQILCFFLSLTQSFFLFFDCLSFTPVIKTFCNKNQMHHAILCFCVLQWYARLLDGKCSHFKKVTSIYLTIYILSDWSKVESVYVNCGCFSSRVNRKDKSVIFTS